ARALFESQVMATYISQINQLQTKSVRESRLKNTTANLRRDFNGLVTPIIEQQEERKRIAARNAAIDARLIPQFAVGGLVPGIDRGRDSVLALLTPGELVLTRAQQLAVMRDGGPNVFERAGVPDAGRPVGPAQAFQTGGIAQPSSFAQSSGRSDAPVVIYL